MNKMCFHKINKKNEFLIIYYFNRTLRVLLILLN